VPAVLGAWSTFIVAADYQPDYESAFISPFFPIDDVNIRDAVSIRFWVMWS
jgi:hypothetical protein